MSNTIEIPATSKTETSLKYLFRGLIIITLVTAFSVFCWLTYLNHQCERFWGEKCAIVAAPESIRGNFTKDWYDLYNNELLKKDNPPASSTIVK